MANNVSISLAQFKSSGVYTVEIDNSERISVTTQSLRLLPGFSSVGVFNSPVFIRSTKDKILFFGNNDTKLEKRGSYFHRSIDTCLLQSPIFAINLLNYDSVSTDEVDFVALSLDTSRNNTLIDESQGLAGIPDVKSQRYIDFFDRSRFWKADPDYLLAVTKTASGYNTGTNDRTAPLIQIVNVGTGTISVIARKAIGLSGYDITARDYYGSDANIPYPWIRSYDKMIDYFIQLIVVQGDWSNYASLSIDPYFSTYFNANGLIPSKINDFINLDKVTLLGSWYGTIIPEFKDQTGADQYIETIVNASTQLTGILINVNQNALNDLVYNTATGQWESGDDVTASAASFLVDMVGHRLYNNKETTASTVYSAFLSYDISVAGTTIYNVIPDASLIGTSGRIFTIDATYNSLVGMGTLMTKNIDPSSYSTGVTYVTSKLVLDSSYIQIETAEPVELSTDNSIYIQKTIDDASICLAYKVIKMDGLTIKNKHIPGYDTTGAPNAEAGVTKVYSMLNDTGILRGLTNPDMINYRYVVDTMAYGLGANCGGKVYLAKLAKARGKTTAIISAPSMTQFATSTNPYFCDQYNTGTDPKPAFSTEYIPTGGNPSMPRSFKFTLPDEDSGAKYCGVFGPYLQYSDNGRSKLIPPAADVSNTYLKKFLGGNPYVIVANQDGIISNPNVTGIEYAIDKTDRDYLEPFGYNSIIEKPTNNQVLIYSNATSYQSVKSDYNYLHVRELLNTLELQMDDVLQKFVFKYNTAPMRMNVVNQITPILDAAKDSGALVKYEVTMDESNNTPELIDDSYGIMDVGVWCNKGMQKIINRISVNKLGKLSTGGFTF